MAATGCENEPVNGGINGDDTGNGSSQEPGFQRYRMGILYDNTAKVYKSTYQVFLPENYEQDLETRYPVVYMLHGYGDSGKDWDKWLTTIKSLEKNGLQPMIYVFPDCNNSYYCNYYDQKAMYMDLVIDNLIPLIDSTYRTIPDRDHRATLGYSMGGFGAMVLPLKNPDVFGYSVPLSMSFRTDEQYMAESQSGWNNQWGKIFGGEGKSGEGRLTDYYKAHCPFYQFTSENKETLSQVKWFFSCGDDEEQLLIANDNLHVQLRDNGYDHEFRIGDGAHTGSYWRSAAAEALPWIQHHMNGGGEWTKQMSSYEVKTSTLNEDGAFASNKYNELTEKSGLAIYFAHKGMNAEQVSKCIGMMSQSGGLFSYMVLPCDLNVKSLNEWMSYYNTKYGIGGTTELSHVVAIGDTGREAYAAHDSFNRLYFIDADIAEDESTIVANPKKSYFIYQTDDAVNYKDMNALYRACKFAPKGDGTFTEADFEYRMLNGSGNDEERLFRAISTLVGNLKYK